MCMLMNAAIQRVSTRPFFPGVLGHCPTCSWEPAKPPTRPCTSYIPEGGLASRHSEDPTSGDRLYTIRVAPAVFPCVETMVSDHSLYPCSPVLPTKTTGRGESMSENLAPAAMMTEDIASPTIRQLSKK